MTKEDNEKQIDESKERAKEALRSEAKALAAQGFNKEQIAKQLSSKHQITIAEATAAIAEDDK